MFLHSKYDVRTFLNSEESFLCKPTQKQNNLLLMYSAHMQSNINILSFSISHQRPRTELIDAKIQINIASLQEEYIILKV